jgi:galactokinase
VVEVAARDDGRVRLHSLAEQDDWCGRIDEIAPRSPGGWAGYAAGVLWALRQAGHEIGGIDLLVTDTVPLGAGLSSSAALECSTALAVDELFGLGLGGTPSGRRALAAACISAENDVVGAATGGMDQATSLLGVAGHALLLDMRDGTDRAVPFAPADDGLVLMVIDTRVRHRLADGQYGMRRAAVEKAAAALGRPSLRDATLAEVRTLDPDLAPRARHIVTEIARVGETVELLDAGRLPEIGPLLDASHASLAHDYEVSCDELDLACFAARRAGALGARMTGGGFGGSAIALVPVDRADAVASEVRAAFAEVRYREPEIRGAQPSAGAERVG